MRQNLLQSLTGFTKFDKKLIQSVTGIPIVKIIRK